MSLLGHIAFLLLFQWFLDITTTTKQFIKNSKN